MATKFTDFAVVLQKLEETGSRNEVTAMLAEFLPRLASSEIKPAMYLMQGRLVPGYVDLEFNFSQKLALRSLEMHVAKQPEEVNKLFGKLGDVGLAAQEILIDSGSSPELGSRGSLSIEDVYQRLEAIAQLEGKGSQDGKVVKFGELINDLDPLSARYVSRVVIGSLRLGLSDKTVLDALSWAKTGDKSLRKIIERAYGVRADIGEIAEIVLQTETAQLPEKLARITLKAGVPVAAKLVEREKDAAAVAERLQEFIVQPKLDGMRAQVHMDSERNVTIYSRNMESLTDMFPDVIAATQQLKVKSIVYDSEVIGYDYDTQTYLPFQETMQRRRKHDVAETTEAIPVKAMAFDLLYLDGEDISQTPLEDRLAKLKQLLAASDQKLIELLDSPQMATADALEEYFLEKVGLGLEGVIVKKLGTSYDPGTRNFDWIKLKANTRSELVDTIDVVVLGYFFGQGVRAKFGVGALLVGIYDEADGKYYSTAKVGTGMKDSDWEIIKQDLTPLELTEQPDDVVVDKILHPDVWVKPEIVMEVDADEITRSPGHTAARELKAKFETDTKGRGLSLRFPRMKVWKRDKKAEQATSAKELLRLFELRKGGI